MQIKSITIQIKDKELTFTLEELIEFKKKTDQQLKDLKELLVPEKYDDLFWIRDLKKFAPEPIPYVPRPQPYELYPQFGHPFIGVPQVYC